jgi:hypothetical protein
MIHFNWCIIVCMSLFAASTHVRSTNYNVYGGSNPKSKFTHKASECSSNERDGPSIRPPCGKAFGIPSFRNGKTKDADDSDEFSDFVIPAAWNDNWESNNNLWIAARLGSVEDLELAISSGASVNAREAVLSRTAMHFAAERGHTNVVLKLLAAGADIDARNEANFTVVILEYCVDYCHLMFSPRHCTRHAPTDISTQLACLYSSVRK